ncbi:MAG: NIPSNAP family protein [Gammaproteobacteria bacterium]
MPLYEKRTYSVMVGKMADVIRVYSELGYPLFERGGFDKYLVGYFISDTGPLHQLIHIWRFADDNDRRAFWKRLAEHPDFQAFASQVRPMVQAQDVQLMNPAPWGPQP